VFESGAILLHLAEKFGAFLPITQPARAECLAWLFWQMGSAPYLGGGFGHFYAYAPTKMEYPIDRFAMEVKRQLDVLDRRLAESAFLAGDDYTIADIAVWAWYGALAQGKLYSAGEFLQVQDYTHVQRWTATIAARPAVQRGRRVNRVFGDPAEQLPERHDASDGLLRPRWAMHRFPHWLNAGCKGCSISSSRWTSTCRGVTSLPAASSAWPTSPPWWRWTLRAS
jgi:GST-like protein